MTPPETCKKAWSEPFALIFITLSNFLYIYNLVPRVTSAAFLVVSGESPMWRHPSRLSARIRQEHVPKNGHPKRRRWFSYHNTRKDNGHNFSLLTISKTVHKCSEGIYLILKCSRPTFVEQLWEFFSSRSGTFRTLLLFLLFLFCQASRCRFWILALSAHLDSANWPGTTYGLCRLLIFVQHMFTQGRIMFQWVLKGYVRSASETIHIFG